MSHRILVALAFAGLFIAVGCSSATPTKPAPSPTPVQVIVVVSPTPPPATATSAPTVALPPTPVVTATVPLTTPVPAKPATPKPAATKKPAPTITHTPAPALKLAAPTLLSPMFTSGGQKDERHSPGDALKFIWTSVGGLNGDECYLVTVSFNPGAGDSFLGPCADQTPAQSAVSFTLNQPRMPGPNYSALLPNPISDTTVSWYVTVVKDNGAAPSGAVGPGGARHRVTPLSPPSSPAQFPLKGS